MHNAVSILADCSDVERFSTRRKIESFANLPDRWFGGEGEVFETSTLKSAIKLEEMLCALGFLKTDAFPGCNGEVVITGYWERYSLELTIEESGRVTFVREENSQELGEPEVIDFRQCEERIRLFRGMIWSSLELSTQYTTTVSKNDFEVLPSSHQVKRVVVGSPSLMEIVRKNLAPLTASTLRLTTSHSLTH